MTKTQDTAQAAATAAQTVATAASTAATAVAQAAAQTNATMATDISWMKGSLVKIETKLDQIDGKYLTQTEFNEHLKIHVDLENRMRKTTDLANTTATQLKTWGVVFIVITTIINIFIKFL